MLTFFHVVMARLRAFLYSADLERDFKEELEAHLAMAEEDKIRQGMTPEEARRRSRVELGGVARLREAGREARGLPGLDLFWLDMKLSLRMLRKSWGLTLIGGLAMTIAISIGVIVFWFLEMFFFPTLPLVEGDQIVAIQTWDEKGHRRRNSSQLDVERWRETLRSVQDFGAFQTSERNLVVADGPANPVSVAEMTASGFQLARVPPLLGRPLVEEDEGQGANPVVVIGYDVWQSKFSADPRVVGQTVHLSGITHQVVGVMPRGFSFPVNHSFWTPLRENRWEDLRDAGPEGVIFARLAPGFTLEGVQAELTSLGLLAMPAMGEVEEELRPRVVPYAFAFTGDFESGQVPWVIRIILFLMILLLVPPCANIAILVYARTITRQDEFAARTALGASRRRIVGQLFIELLALALGAAGAALVFTSFGGVYLRDRVLQQAGDKLPFWIDFTLSFRTILFAVGLAVVAATIAGVVPALKATGRQMQDGFSALGTRTGMRLGGTWTALVITQVALTLAVLPAAVEMGWGTVREGFLGPGFAAEEYLTARLAVDRDAFAGQETEGGSRSFAPRFAALQGDFIQRVKAEPGVLGVALSSSVPGDEPWARIEVEETEQEASLVESQGLVQFNQVDDTFFQVLDVPLLTGREFEAGDFEPTSSALIVNQTFARLHLGEGNPLGRRLRYIQEIGGAALVSQGPEAWHEIVGVVADRPADPSHGTVYHPMVPGQVHPVSLALHLGLQPISLADRLRAITTELDPALRVEEVWALDEIYRQQQVGNNMGALSLALVTLSVLLLSAAGMYALMSFTVNQRRREIGIRSALGAQPHRLLMGIFRRALVQIGIGAALGALIALLLDFYLPMEEIGGWEIPGIIPAAAIFMLSVGLLATAGPARRGLQVDPIEELREG